MASPPHRSVTRRLTFTLAMVVIVLGTAELLARMLGREVLDQAASPPPAAEDGSPNLLGNPYLLYEMAPGKRFEKGIDIAINSYGLRGPEWTADKPEGVRRIMALGDSSVYGFGVEDHEVFTALMDEALGPRVEVINSAVPGYSTYQTINLLEIRSLALKPDLLLIGCIWSDNNFDSFVDRDLLAAYSSFRNRHARVLHEQLERSALYAIMDYKLRVLTKFPEERRVGWMIGRGEKIGERRVPIQEYARNLETIVELAKGIGAEVAFMVLPNREDLVTVYESGAAWDPYREVMRDTARRHGAPVLELPDHFLESGQEADELFLDEMHPTALGHRLWADLALATIEERGFTEGRPITRDPQPSPIPTYRDPFVEGDHSPEPPAEAPQPGGATTSAPAPPSGGSAVMSLSGELVIPEEYLGAPIQLDVLQPSAAQPTILGSVRLTTAGPFVVALRARADRVGFVAYIDRNGDGPGAGDTRIELHQAGLPVPAEGELEGVLLDLAEGTVTQTFGSEAGPVAPQPVGNGMVGGVIVTDQPGALPPRPGVVTTDQALDRGAGGTP